ncbi:MAG: hypothetical protein V7L14_24620 [Nostoc sp.]
MTELPKASSEGITGIHQPATNARKTLTSHKSLLVAAVALQPTQTSTNNGHWALGIGQ